jgi:hypothetical protein
MYICTHISGDKITSSHNRTTHNPQVLIATHVPFIPDNDIISFLSNACVLKCLALVSKSSISAEKASSSSMSAEESGSSLRRSSVFTRMSRRGEAPPTRPIAVDFIGRLRQSVHGFAGTVDGEEEARDAVEDMVVSEAMEDHTGQRDQAMDSADGDAGAQAAQGPPNSGWIPDGSAVRGDGVSYAVASSSSSPMLHIEDLVRLTQADEASMDYSHNILESGDKNKDVPATCGNGSGASWPWDPASAERIMCMFPDVLVIREPHLLDKALDVFLPSMGNLAETR